MMKLLLVLFCTSAFATDTCLHNKTKFSCVNFIRNYDGDTITVNIPNVPEIIGENISVRVRGIDTPEMKGKDECLKEKARTARKLVTNLLKNAKRIDLSNIGRDKYFRILADVEYDGKSLAETLIKNGLAEKYDGGRKTASFGCQKPAVHVK